MSDDGKLTQDEARRIVNDGISKDVRALRDGRQDREAARRLLEEFRLSNPRNIPEHLLSWLHDAFGRILDGEAPEKALGLKRERGQRKKVGRVDKTAIAMFVELKEREGVEHTRAMENACDYFHREIDTIRAAVNEIELNPGVSEETMKEYIQEHKHPE